MHFLAYLNAAFSVAIATLLAENPNGLDLFANLPPLDSLLTGSSPLNPITPGEDGSTSLSPTTPENNPSSFNLNLNMDPFKTPNMLESFAFSPDTVQESSARGTAEPSIIDPSTMYTEAMHLPTDSNKVCYAHIRTGRRKDEMKGYCEDISRYLFRPEGSYPRPSHLDKEQERQNDELSYADERWMLDLEGKSDNERYDRLSTTEKGRKACIAQDWHGRVKDYPYPVCCFGPEEPEGVGNLMIVYNVLNCLRYIMGRPLCQREAPPSRYCCRSIDSDDDHYGRWGFKGLDCALMLRNPEEILGPA